MAKIIFGTVRDERLKKNELRITVIAANFPNSEAIKKSLFDNTDTVSSSLFEARSAKTENVEKGNGKIFNSVPLGSTNSFAQPTSNSTDSVKIDIDKKKTDKDEDDWNAIPAFLRRSKLK